MRWCRIVFFCLLLMLMGCGRGMLMTPPAVPTATLTSQQMIEGTEEPTDQPSSQATPTAMDSPQVPSTATEAPPEPTATHTAPPAPEKPTFPAAHITLVYDNMVYDPDLTADWGFGAWVVYGEHTILFDTGARGDILLSNLTELALDPQEIDAVVLSHIHGDHVDGLAALLDTGITPTVYLPASFPPTFKESVRARTEVVEIGAEPHTIFPGVHATGKLYGSVVEQGMIVETADGSVVITGCSHPGIVRIVERSLEAVPGDVALVVGGFHLMQTSSTRVVRIIETLRELGVERVSPTHCTGEAAIAAFAESLGEDYVPGGVGQVIVVGE